MAVSAGQVSRKDTSTISALAVLNALIILTNVGIISYIVDNILEGKIHENATPNSATTFLIIFSVTGVLIGATSCFLGLIHGARTDHALRSVAFGLSMASNIFYFLALGFGSKQTKLGGVGSLPKAVFALDVVLCVTGSLYTILLYMGIPHDHTAGVGHSPAGTHVDHISKV